MNSFSITVADAAEKINIEIIDIDIVYAVNDVPCLKLRLLDDPSNDKSFVLSSKKIFIPGKVITVTTGDKKITLFNGIITGLSVGCTQDYYLDVIAHGDVIKMTEGLTTQLFEKMDDSNIIKKLLDDSGVKINSSAKKSIEHDQYFCYQQSSWRVMMARLIANGFVFVPSPGNNEIIDLQTYTAEKASIKLNKSEVRSFQFDLDVRSQIKSITAKAWSIEDQKVGNEVKGNAGDYRKLENNEIDSIIPSLTLSFNMPKAPKELEASVTAQNNYRLLDLYQGRLTLVILESSEVPNITLMQKLNIEGAGTKFSGDYIVTRIRHRTINKQWLIDLELGLPLAKTLNSPYASLPPLPNFTGLVKKNEQETENLGRIRIKLPLISETQIWARLLSPFASNKEGLFFPPNEGDEVNVGFIEGDCRYPVILGSCHSKKNEQPVPFDPNNGVKGIYTLYAKEPEGTRDNPMNHKFDMTGKFMEISSGKESNTGKITINGDTGTSLAKGDSSLTIGDKVDIISKDVMTLTTDKDINIKASGKVVVTAQVTEVK